ncbi:MAG TPA: ABC transporter permease [Terriglobales bacterium]|nr:ABC transporter permease [Terriglobales bacterium]
MFNVNLNHIWIVARREYLERVRTKAFIIMTIITPLMMFGFAVVPSLISMRKAEGNRSVVVVTSNPVLGEAIRNELVKPLGKDELAAQEKKRDGAVPSLQYQVELSSATSESAKADLQARIDKGALDGFLWLPEDAVTEGKYSYFARSTSDFVEMNMLQSAVNRATIRHNLNSHGIAGEEFERVTKRLSMEPVTWKDGKAAKGNFLAKLFSSMLLVIMLYVSLLMYGINVMRAVLEEKTSRIMEVLMSALTPAELLSGKILGVGAVGISQALIWMGMGFIITAPGLITASSIIKDVNFTLSTGIFFVTFYLLGYLIYSSMFAAVGSMVNSEQEAQQLQFFVMMPLIISMIMMMMVIKNPNDPVVVVMSMVPFCAPILMYLRIVVEQPPMWQIALSISIMAVSIAGMVWLCARIYRVGILMYGKKPTLPEIVKWIRYA